MRQGWINVGPMSQTVGQHWVGIWLQKILNIQYLNHPPHPNRWMITLIQQGSVCDLEGSEPCCQEDAILQLTSPTQIDRVQNRGAFLWTVINKTSVFFLESVTFQLHARMLSSKVALALKNYRHFSDLGVGIALSHRHVGFFGKNKYINQYVSIFRRQILKYKDSPCTEKIAIFTTVVDP